MDGPGSIPNPTGCHGLPGSTSPRRIKRQRVGILLTRFTAGPGVTFGGAHARIFVFPRTSHSEGGAFRWQAEEITSRRERLTV